MNSVESFGKEVALEADDGRKQLAHGRCHLAGESSNSLLFPHHPLPLPPSLLNPSVLMGHGRLARRGGETERRRGGEAERRNDGFVSCGFLLPCFDIIIQLGGLRLSSDSRGASSSKRRRRRRRRRRRKTRHKRSIVFLSVCLS